MKIPALACALVCFFAATESTKAQEIGDLQHIAIVVESLDKDSESVGLTRQALCDMVLVALKRDIPKLRIDDPPMSSFFYVSVNTIVRNDLAVCSVNVAVERPAEIAGDNGRKLFSVVKVWDRGRLLTGSGMASRIHDYINDSVTAFAAKYYKDNP